MIFKDFDIKCINWLSHHLDRTKDWSQLKKKSAGLVIFTIGVIFIFTPGPGIVFLAAGGTLLSERFGIFIAQKIQQYLKWRGFEKPPYSPPS